ncbi:hypothetical protein [Boseongicola aestuarii]|uniref:FHA domain-containing protein n=1 Tax=Boseongicola aestuarii TaxID=1470561 RepID=A0A238J3Y8_9RHOB|nr:hypothetical protein [Boseongicola aestuarii]SMX25053.1 hypothetical protein BOA8489_03187 [Boseongicola aestuarii]
MLGKLFGRNGGAKPKKDVAIIHQSVPDEVLNIQPEHPETLDTSWMDSTNIVDKPASAKTRTPSAAAVQPPSPPAQIQMPPAAPSAFANPKAATGVRCPHGWLVVVEGPGVGEWFVLEGGVSQIGQDADQTIPLTFGDTSIAPKCHAQLQLELTAGGLDILDQDDAGQ